MNFRNYNINGISKCFKISKSFSEMVYDEGEKIGSFDYKEIIRKMKSKNKQKFIESQNEYMIDKISADLGISQKYATKIFEEGQKIGSKDYKEIYAKMKFVRGMKMYITQLQKEIEFEKQGGKND